MTPDERQLLLTQLVDFSDDVIGFSVIDFLTKIFRTILFGNCSILGQVLEKRIQSVMKIILKSLKSIDAPFYRLSEVYTMQFIAYESPPHG